MGDLRYNDIYNQGHQGKQSPVISLKQYSDGLVAYEREKEKEDSSQKSFTNKWEKLELLNVIGEPSAASIYKQKSKCTNNNGIEVVTVCNYSLDSLFFSIHIQEQSNLVNYLKSNKKSPVKVNLLNNHFNLTYDGAAFFNPKICIYPVVNIPIDIVSRYLQKPENWTCRILFGFDCFEFGLTGNLSAPWC